MFSLCLTSCNKDKKTNAAAEKMQEFVINISQYAKSINPDFIIIPQNGIELAYNQIDPGNGFNYPYLSAINGIGVEELFYNGSYSPDQYRLTMLRQLKNYKKILVSEYVSDDSNIADAIAKNTSEGFLCFPRSVNNYHYLLIPPIPVNPNSNSIENMPQVSNYLYLISTSNFNSKDDMVAAIAATNYDLVLIDLFFQDNELTNSDIQAMKTKANGGHRKVISYISIGSAENYRYYWQSHWKLHKPKWIKKKYEEYEDEFWVEFWDEEWQNIIYGNENSYVKKIINAGFDGAYLDNVEAYYFLYHKE